jgi:thioredoxin reductase (NADPH)
MATDQAPDATRPRPSALTPPTREEMFPRLTPAQVERVAALGDTRTTAGHEVLIEPGDQITSFFVVAEGDVEIVRPTDRGEDLLVVHGPGEFVGELNSLSGRRSLVRARTRGATRLVTLTREALLGLVQTDAELSEILMRAFILRRIELLRGRGDVVVVGSSHSAGTLRVKEFLSRNGYPHSYLDLERDADAQELLDRLHIAVDEIPVVLCPGNRTLRHPTNAQVAECLGFNEAVDETKVRDLVVIGAGPAGLAAAVYAASEGLDVLVLETVAPGGQAGSSSKIENYLGFPLGIAGQELAARAYNQAQKFGAEMLVARGASRLACARTPYAVETEGGTRLLSRSVVIATGAQYRKPPLPDLARFEGAGVYYGATFLEQQVCGDEDVVVVGGGNSAGQAAVFLAQSRRHVFMLVRGAGLVESMSRYLIRRIEESKQISLLTHTEITAMEGDDRLERVIWTHRPSGRREVRDIRHVFLMTGAVPNTAWLDGCVALDRHGFIRTGVDLVPADLEDWPLARAPFQLETSLPGVFAVGDVRAGNVKRVASAVGEGSAAVSLVHKALAG